jgi:hypothetical protein
MANLKCLQDDAGSDQTIHVNCLHGSIGLIVFYMIIFVTDVVCIRSMHLKVDYIHRHKVLRHVRQMGKNTWRCSYVKQVTAICEITRDCVDALVAFTVRSVSARNIFHPRSMNPAQNITVHIRSTNNEGRVLTILQIMSYMMTFTRLVN